MAATPVTPIAGINSIVVTGGVPVIAVNPGPNGGYIVNPYTATDQGIGAAEPLYVDPVGNAGLAGNGTTTALQPGQSYPLIPGSTNVVTVNAVSSGHRFTVVSY